jgi:hypothetical protein
MAIPLTKKEIIDWYNILQDFYKSNLSFTPYCKKNNISLPIAYSRKTYIEASFIKDEQTYQKYLNLVKEYDVSDWSFKDFISKHDLNKAIFEKMIRHLSYYKVIEEYKASKEINTPRLKFIEVKQDNELKKEMAPIVSPIIEPEIKRKSMEILIDTDIKLILPAHTNTEKLIKIIDALKDL